MKKSKRKSSFECPVYKEHVENLKNRNFEILESLGFFISGNIVSLDDLEAKVNGFDSSKIMATADERSVYSGDFALIAQKYNFPENRSEECRSILEMAAYIYLAFNSPEWMKSLLKELERRIDVLAKPIENLEFGLKSLNELDTNLDPIFDHSPVTQLIFDTQINLKKLSDLKQNLRDSKAAQMSRLGNKAPLGNPGLSRFVLILTQIWGEILNRTIIQQYDNINGRKQYLEFLCDCMKPLHPALSYETINNALSTSLREARQNMGK